MISLLAIVDRAPAGVAAVACDGFDAVIGPEPLPLGVEAIKAHEAEVRRIAGLCEACLPARFGAGVADEATLRKQLEERGPELREALQLVRGREQMTLRVLGERAQAAPATGTEYLLARYKHQTLPELQPLREAVARFVRAEKIEPHDQPGLLATVAHLIDRGASAEYVAAVDAVELFELRVKQSGPWPAWSFAPEVAP